MVAHNISDLMEDLIPNHRVRIGWGACRNWSGAPIPFIVPEVGWPTEAPPGTLEKLAVFKARHERLEELFHPYDARFDGDDRPLVFYLNWWREEMEPPHVVFSGSDDNGED